MICHGLLGGLFACSAPIRKDICDAAASYEGSHVPGKNSANQRHDLCVIACTHRVTTGRNGEDGRSADFAGFCLRHQRIGTR
jgi:hypothetical protein